MKNNGELKTDAGDAISFDPFLIGTETGVKTGGGKVVILTGTAEKNEKELHAETAVSDVAGVKAIVEEIKVKTFNTHKEADETISAKIIELLKKNWIPTAKLKITVENGWVNLGGELSWNFQKDAVKNILHAMEGIMGITNDIIIKA
jgi:osmotically-inducible protein OsmY